MSKFGHLLLMFFALFFTACGSKDAQTALEEAARQFEDAVKNRQGNAAMELLHTDFMAQQTVDRQQARQYMTGVFLRYKQINALVLNRECQLDKGFYDLGHCTAQVGITGAQGLLPERAEYLQVTSTWQRTGEDWLLLKLDWQ